MAEETGKAPESTAQLDTITLSACQHTFHRGCLEVAERIDHPDRPMSIDEFARCPCCRRVSERGAGSGKFVPEQE